MSNDVTSLSRGRLLLAGDEPMSPAQKSVWMCLSDRSNDAGVAWPSIPGICDWTGLRRTAVIDALKTLEGAGWLRIERESGRNNRVTMNLDKLRTHFDQSAPRTGPADEPVRETDPHQSAARTPPVRETDPTRPADGPEASVSIKEASVKQRDQRSAPKRRIPEDWQPDEKLTVWAQEKLPGVDLCPVVENFRNHHLAKGEARASWPASFRVWVNNEIKFAVGRKPPQQQRSKHTGFATRDYREGVGPNGEILV